MAADTRPTSLAAIGAQAEPRQSFRLLESLHQKRAPVDLKLCNAALSNFAKGGHWCWSLALLSHLSAWDLQADVVSLSMTFSAMRRDQPWQNAIDLLESLDVVPDKIALNGLMCLLPWRPALELLSSLPERRMEADQATFNGALNALDNWQMVLSLLNSMPLQAVQPDLGNWNTAMKVCGHLGQWEWVLALLQSLPAPDHASFTTAIIACPQWPLALELWAAAPKDAGLNTAVLQALAPFGEWEICLHIFTAQSSSSALRHDCDVAQVVKAALSAGRQDLRAMIRALDGERVTYNTILQEFSRLGYWQQSLDLLSAMISSRVPPDDYSYGLCIGSCDSHGAWQLALRLLGVMPARTLMPQLKTYQVAAGVCARAGQWNAVLRLLEMLGPEDADRVVSEALDACHLSRQSAAAAQLALATARQRATEAEKDAVRARFLSAMRTCVSCREWPLVMDLFERLPQVRVTNNGILKQLVEPFAPKGNDARS